MTDSKSKKILEKICSKEMNSKKLSQSEADILLNISRYEGQIEALQRIKPSTSRTSVALSEALKNRDKLIEMHGYNKLSF